MWKDKQGKEPWGHFENFFENNIFGGGTAPFA